MAHIAKKGNRSTYIYLYFIYIHILFWQTEHELVCYCKQLDSFVLAFSLSNHSWLQFQVLENR